MKISRRHQSGNTRPLIATLLALAAYVSPVIAGEAGPADSKVQAERVRFFEQRVRPLLVEKCNACHGAEKQKGGLRLDSREAMLKGGESGPAVVPGKPDESLLVEAVNYEGLEMPPSGKLEPDEIEVLTRWVAMGAPWPAAGTSGSMSTGKKTGPLAATSTQARFSDGDRTFWSFQPPRPPMAATVSGACSLSPGEPWSDWSQNPIDRFILKGLLEKGLTPAPEADRLTLIRRATFDLTGLPPTPEEIDAFLADQGARRLRATWSTACWPRPGTASDGGGTGSTWFATPNRTAIARTRFVPTPGAIATTSCGRFNTDKPYDRFLTEQLAGDELDPDDPELRVATGLPAAGHLRVQPAQRSRASGPTSSTTSPT